MYFEWSLEWVYLLAGDLYTMIQDMTMSDYEHVVETAVCK